MLDSFDIKILDALQHNSDLSLSQLAERVNLTKNPCWRRIKQLQKKGFINKNVTLLNAEKLNVEQSVFVHIRTNQHTTQWIKKFAKIVGEIPEVVEFYRMSGDIDYVLKIVVPSIKSYNVVYNKLISSIDIANVSSHFAMEEIKNTTVLPLDYLK